MKRFSACVALAGLVTSGSGVAVGADEIIRRPAGERTDLQQFFFPLTDITRGTGETAILPFEVQILQAIGGGIAPRLPDFIYVPTGGGGGGDPGGGDAIGASKATALRIPATARILPPDARTYVARAVGLPQTQAQRAETLRALENLIDVPTAQARQMFTAPGFIKDGQKTAFFRNQVQKLATGRPTSTHRYAVVVAPEGSDPTDMASIREQAKAHVSFEGVAADTLLVGTLSGTVTDGTVQEFGKAVSESMGASTGQVWFANGVETVLPQTAATLLNADKIGGIVTATAQGATAVRATDSSSVADAIAVFGSVAEQLGEDRTRDTTVQTIVEAVGPTALVTYASTPAEAGSAAQAIRSNKRFGDAGRVAVLIQGNAGTEMLLY